MKIAMWSGPRNLSTAMMYAFGNRADFAAWDEPFYAAYLKRSGIDHPMRDEIIARHDADSVSVSAQIAGPVPDGKEHWYMKHMGIHMEDTPLDWAEDCVNVHLIRHPARVIASYAAKRENPSFWDIGFQQQLEIYERFPGPVIDSADIRRDPEGMLRKLCDVIGLEFDPAMLSWQAGPRDFDGVWAAHWYGAVHKSTGFARAEGVLPELSPEAQALCDQAMPIYAELGAKKL
ncbi:HAD family hydrolase [Tropicibacter sp. R15_0]|uniref:sulfotransferase-like domain-containing protein n=1 Tax=Tropicibacter sp. R15_0 TaxID=2821101 RepID=UPI001ADA9035|nr:HAD family hydrolase [Tropicibacter sp. R15_0]MBO9463818.1 HAD family hydrolase [Tropicibacter sp. R15_0]